MTLVERHAYQAGLLLMGLLDDYHNPQRRGRFEQRRIHLLALLELGLSAAWCDTCGGPKSHCGPHCKTKGEDTP